MKKISNEQIEAIMKTMMDLNVPVKVYAGIQEMFNKLPEVITPNETPDAVSAPTV